MRRVAGTLLALTLALVSSACTQPEPRKGEPTGAAASPSEADPAAVRCAEECVAARQMEARDHKAIEADCRAVCEKDPAAYPVRE